MSTSLPFTATSIALIASLASAAQPKQEPVKWDELRMYNAAEIGFKSEIVSIDCHQCKYTAIETKSGITALYIEGDGRYQIFNQNRSGEFGAVMVKLNPAELENFVKIKGSERVNDKGALESTLPGLRASFKRSYHAGWDAYIPERGDYTLHIDTKDKGTLSTGNYGKMGEIFFDHGDKKIKKHSLATGETTNWQEDIAF